MIAPIRESNRQAPEATSRVGEMRRIVASLFLSPGGDAHRPPAPIAAWKAWSFLAWAAAVTGIYFLTMIGVF
ncbi:MAG: hypothetical protein PHO07_05150 [Pirellulales bacterium]|jgi:hypothetical protein|nr:hypothetical protein [Thermoguttaceae bacterium]MDD4786541.1 hypothetical protein [Pirellulales bacterium]MDI9443857.1 hypothetical protein [Planctomycetota bacterium]NLY99451.1 hypothetical protein [Pirellulaceae bacterium]